MPDPKRPVHPLTLHFSNGELESAYAARSFGESYHAVVASCSALSLLCVLLLAAEPAIRASSLIGLTVFSTMLGARILLHRMLDQARAHTWFAWSWCAVWTISWAQLALAQRRDGLIHGVAFPAFVGVNVVLMLATFFQRMISLPMAPRLVTIAAILTSRVANLLRAHLPPRPPRCSVPLSVPCTPHTPPTHPPPPAIPHRRSARRSHTE